MQLDLSCHAKTCHQTYPSGHMTSIQRRLNFDACRCIDVETTLYKRHVPAGMLPASLKMLECDEYTSQNFFPEPTCPKATHLAL